MRWTRDAAAVVSMNLDHSELNPVAFSGMIAFLAMEQ
jgi:hypothetical protein